MRRKKLNHRSAASGVKKLNYMLEQEELKDGHSE